jgi:hypothetical protein
MGTEQEFATNRIEWINGEFNDNSGFSNNHAAVTQVSTGWKGALNQ